MNKDSLQKLTKLTERGNGSRAPGLCPTDRSGVGERAGAARSVARRRVRAGTRPPSLSGAGAGFPRKAACRHCFFVYCLFESVAVPGVASGAARRRRPRRTHRQVLADSEQVAASPVLLAVVPRPCPPGASSEYDGDPWWRRARGSDGRGAFLGNPLPTAGVEAGVGAEGAVLVRSGG